MGPAIEPVIERITALVIKPLHIGQLVPTSDVACRLKRAPVSHPLTDLDCPEPARRLLVVQQEDSSCRTSNQRHNISPLKSLQVKKMTSGGRILFAKL